MYRVILVDDEEEIREGIKRRIDWAACGFELVATAENGQDAMEKAEILRPDVVITDIKMPYVDGLTLGKWLFERMPGIKLVIFSGFDDFEYAQKAIKIGVAEYILKPINASELTDVLRKLAGQLDIAFDQERKLAILRQHYEESLPVLRQQFLTRLVDGRVAPEQIPAGVELHGIDLTGSFWTVAVVQAHLDQSPGPLVRESELVPLSLRSLIDEHLPRFCRTVNFVYNDNAAVIAPLSRRTDIMSLIAGLEQICKMAPRFLGLSLTAGIGSPCDSLTELHNSTNGAHSALDYRLVLGTGKAIYLDDIEPDPTARLAFQEQDKRDLTFAIKMGTDGEIQRWIDRLIISPTAVGLPIAQYRLYLMELMAELVSIMRTYQLDFTEIFGPDFDGTFPLSQFDSAAQLGVWFLDICRRVGAIIRRERTTSSKATVESAKEFIAANYSDPDISVEMLCDHLHVSPAYFSTLFKRETGMSFVGYLTQVRLEQAVRLLNTTQDKTYEISLKVGYSEPSYFSYVFRKQFGLSPSKYRGSKELTGV